MIGKFAVSLATMALSATVLVAQTSTTPPTVKPATQVTKTPAQTPAAKPAQTPAAKPATTSAKPATAETKAEKKTAEEQKKADKKAAEQKKKAADEQAEAAEEGSKQVVDGQPSRPPKPRSSRQQVGEGPSARQRNWLRYSPEASHRAPSSNRRGASPSEGRGNEAANGRGVLADAKTQRPLSRTAALRSG